MIAVPWSPIEPETRMRSPGRSDEGESCARGSSRPRPVVVMYIESHLPRSTTFVSPATTSTPAASAAAAIASTSCPQLVGREALLEHERERQRERSGARDGEVVDRAVDGQLADRSRPGSGSA